jgi:hypothetical protein
MIKLYFCDIISAELGLMIILSEDLVSGLTYFRISLRQINKRCDNMSSDSEITTLLVMIYLNGSGSGVQHSESLGLWTLSIVRNSKY